MNVVASAGREEVAVLYIVRFDSGKMAECVEALQPPFPREQKWILQVSTLFGCPIGCAMCDAGGHYQGNLTAGEIFDQIDFLIRRRFGDGIVPSRQFKIQFARMGEPALNPHVLTVLEELPRRFRVDGLMPSLSTVAPRSSADFFRRLLRIKREKYAGGKFQLQFSLHATDEKLRSSIIPVRAWSFREMAEYGDRFYSPGDRKLTLNFALARGASVEPAVLLRYFSPDRFLIKMTPLNPTYRAQESGLFSHIDPLRGEVDCDISTALRKAGYEVIVSIGEVEENSIGSNCGQYLRRHLAAHTGLSDAYTCDVHVHAGGLSGS
ncbi:MAG: radical SAM protein [Bacteroidota bacterium]